MEKVSFGTKVRRKLAYVRRGMFNTSFYVGNPHHASAYWYDGTSNFGDLFTPFLLEYLHGVSVRNVRGVSPSLIRERILFGAGSTLQNISTKRVTVWGTGFMAWPRKPIRHIPAEVLAVRGPKTAKIAEDLGWPIAPVYGDPGLLASLLVAQRPAEISYGVIPHFAHFDHISRNIDSFGLRLIDVRKPLMYVLRQISGCEMVFSSSLHGLIVAHSMNIPAVRISGKYSLSGGDFKFDDYFESVDVACRPLEEDIDYFSKAKMDRYRHLATLVSAEKVKQVQDALLRALGDSQFIRDVC